MKIKKRVIKEAVDNHFYYVGVGASAGGLEALKDLFLGIPENITEMAFIVIQHLSPDYKSLMDELLARYTKMPIHIAKEGMEVLGGHVYLIPPKKNLSVSNGVLQLEDKREDAILNLPIDIFFRSLALDQGNKAISIVLSGTGSDGTLGIKSIKEAGGMIMVQSEESAKFDGMPRSSISTGLVDYILEPSQMGEELLSYVKHPLEKEQRKEISIISKDVDVLTQITRILREYCGIDFSYYKENTLVRRIERRVKIKRFLHIDEYVQLLKESDKEKETLYRELLIGVTSFFRDGEIFEILRQKVIPNLNYDKRTIRIWSTGCSTGEEVYSIAILIHDHIKKNNIDCEVKIFATDIDKYALEVAGKGFYPDSVMADVKPEYLAKYFEKMKTGYVINDMIRNMVVFARHNVMKDPPFSKLDLLICRNLFIYIKPEMQQKILSAFYYSLQPEGYLFLGNSESLGDMNEAFLTIHAKSKIYQFKPGYREKLKTAIDLVQDPLDERKMPINRDTYSRTMKLDKLVMGTLSKVLPPSVIIDQDDNIIQVINDVSDILKIQSGIFTANLFMSLTKDMSLVAKNVVRKLKNGQDNISFNVRKDQKNHHMSIVGRIIEIKSEQYYLLSFIDNPDRKQATAQNEVILHNGEVILDQISFLEKELQISQDNLQATIEELETSNEELQSSNEELIASNEELQSTNEELQSVNEELYTVNSEYQSKIDEMVNLNNDLSNLIRNTEVGALYLDRKLCIRKLTKVVSRVTNVIDSDVGRPISHIAISPYYANMMNDINKVVETLQGIEEEIQDAEGNIWLTRIRPFRTEYNAVEGIIITFVDITNYRRAMESALMLKNRERRIMDIGQIAWWEWDLKTNQVTFDDLKATMLGYKPEEFPTDVYAICDLIHPEDYEKTMDIMKRHLSGETKEWRTIYRIKRKDGSYSRYYDRGMVIHRDADGKPTLLAGTVTDMSDID